MGNLGFVSVPLLIVFLAVSLFTHTPLTAGDDKWHLTCEADGITVYRRELAGSKFLEFKAEGNLRGTVNEYVSVILDTDNLPNWVPLCLEARNIKKINESEFIVYAAYAGVWPVADRDYTAKLSVVVSDQNAQTVRVDVEQVEMPDTLPVVADRVHIPHLKCCWIFEQNSDTCTRIQIRVHMDPGGWIPAWLLNWGYRKIPYRFLKNLESQVAKLSTTRLQY